MRLLWVDDIEYKSDEDYSTYYALEAGRSEPFPRVGMPSSAGIPNFGASVWAFVVLSRILAVRTPPDLAVGVALCSILAMALYLPVIHHLVPEREREAWCWGVALMALNPLSVFLHRKIWPPALFPLLTLILLAGWLRRGGRLGASLFGACGALLGQLHMAGFFLAAALAGWALLFDRRSVCWRWWFLGSLLGAAPMVPWLMWVYEAPESLVPTQEASWVNVFKARFWLRWLLQPFALDTLNNRWAATSGISSVIP